MKLNPDGKTVAASDLLAPGIGEIIGGSQREDSLEILQNKIKELNMDQQDPWQLLTLRKCGRVQHRGYVCGLKRSKTYISGI